MTITIVIGSQQWLTYWANWWHARAMRRLARGDELECWYSLLMAQEWRDKTPWA